MKSANFISLSYLALFLLAGCSGNSDNGMNAEVVGVAIVNKGATIPDSVSTKALIKADSIEFSKTKSGQVVEKWIKRVERSDLASLQNKMNEYDLFTASDVILQPGQTSCIGCPTFSPPAPDWCSDGTILPPLIDENGCYGPPRCQRNIPCPEFAPPAPDWCEDGTVIPPQPDENGCYGPPTCQRNMRS